MKKHLRILIVMTLIFSACSEDNPTNDFSGPETASSSKTSKLARNQQSFAVIEKLSFFPGTLSDQSFLDITSLTKSMGERILIEVEEGGDYRVKVIVNRGEKSDLVHDQIVKASSANLAIGIYCSLAYQIDGNTINVDESRELLTLELDGNSLHEELPKWHYRPEMIYSKTVVPRLEEEPFIVMFAGNNMWADNFEDAAERASRAHETIIATISEIRKKSNKASHPSPDRNESK